MSARPWYMNPRRQRRRDTRCGDCGWRAQDGHSRRCPVHWQALNTAEQVHDSRVALMVWMETQQAVSAWGYPVAQLAADAAAGISGRARQLGLEDDLPGDSDWGNR